MSFMDNIGKLAGDMLGGANPQDAANAASDHVGTMEPNALADHLTQSLSTMDGSSISSLGQQLLQTFTNHGAYDGDANTAAQGADVTQAEVAAGNPGAVGALIAYAKANPAILQSAASKFFGDNPGVIGQVAPGLLQGILGRLGGR